jgi:hypothetical protein
MGIAARARSADALAAASGPLVEARRALRELRRLPPEEQVALAPALVGHIGRLYGQAAGILAAERAAPAARARLEEVRARLPQDARRLAAARLLERRLDVLQARAEAALRDPLRLRHGR